jgi:hypothetical protein
MHIINDIPDSAASSMDALQNLAGTKIILAVAPV